LQGYIYSSTIINYGGWSTGPTFNIIAMNVGGSLCFWFARQTYWQGFNVIAYTAYGPRALNKVTSITDSANPNGTKQVTFSPAQVLRSDNYNSYAPTLTGTGASGTWGINITGSSASCTGNAATATNASNADLLNSISAINLYNNMGGVHSTRTSFDAVGGAISSGFGYRYVQGSTNGPGTNSATQYYSWNIGLGSDYASTSYAAQFALPRNVSTPYLSVRYEEGGALGSWQKIAAGYADSAGSATTATTASSCSGNAATATTASGVSAGVVAGKTIYDNFTATASQTTFTTSVTYTSGKIEVFANGVKMVNGEDVTVTSGTSVVFASGLAVSTKVTLVYPI